MEDIQVKSIIPCGHCKPSGDKGSIVVRFRTTQWLLLCGHRWKPKDERTESDENACGVRYYIKKNGKDFGIATDTPRADGKKCLSFILRYDKKLRHKHRRYFVLGLNDDYTIQYDATLFFDLGSDY